MFFPNIFHIQTTLLKKWITKKNPVQTQTVRTYTQFQIKKDQKPYRTGRTLMVCIIRKYHLRNSKAGRGVEGGGIAKQKTH